ncbi:MAG: DUF2835 domain-containing protein [gamma proteobacterium symbiont of Bathyaustriella thionipta]|nr:DUF2835 domain-containing protein [gamma proteobacterium symbiont of Bathyaustriella thionipta]MCU7950703.1 DUF2835 domain-containing protein [gamma proteobacterium symbiont of Bathyaustriella thionipta]MCU7953755.1 DUF2835 domain-containing protein [gamma proteobacterium symbiont of Bathyaustriella thionipta]MCU7957478.1 DUF2835 domain-containing protein [gamma proteobacterium symbiont of Bathyaustriella thionipta]MCU7967372.1 DUF2835 domain-containing protein [gamma proteobacterium symbion
MNEIRFRLEISAQEYLRYYQGEVDSVQIRTTDGRIIQFPANALHKYITQTGINGSFRIVFDDNNKMLSMERVSN